MGYKYALNIIISSIPVGICGLLFKNTLENKLSNIIILGFAFLLTALSLFIIKDIKGNKEDKDITIKDAIIIGLFQMITLIPGISRSGTVLVVCMIRKLKRENALKYTFMLYFPVSIGAMILGIKDILLIPNLNQLITPYVLGMISATIVTYFSFEWLSNIVKKGKLIYFAIYCLFLAAFVFIYFR